MLPLTIEAGDAAPRGALASWIEGNRARVTEDLVRNGAILFRGFDIDGAPAFEQVARAIDPELKNDYLGTSPRDALTPYTFSASELPPYYPIPQHCEMSFVKEPPRKLMFCCLVPPSSAGGETPLVDFRAVWRDLDPEVRARFDSRGVRIVRNYSGPGEQARFDPWKLKRWDEMFRTTDRAVVEQKCAENGFEPQWLPGDRLRLVSAQPAGRPHPITGEMVWFNHAQVFHSSAAPAEYRRIAKRLGVRYLALGAYAKLLLAVKAAVSKPEEQPLHCTYGDGSPITAGEMDRVRDAIWKNLVAFRWQRGDVLAIDNFGVSHGRMPYRGPRKIAVAWA